MKKHRTIRYFSCLLTLVSIVGLSAANAQAPAGELTNQQIEIVIDRKIDLPQANRNFDKIPPRASEPIKPPITYDFRAFTFQTPQINPVIRPLKLKDQPKTDMYGGYLTAGYGNYASPYLEGFYNSKKKIRTS